jgi:hypothetical protein
MVSGSRYFLFVVPCKHPFNSGLPSVITVLGGPINKIPGLSAHGIFYLHSTSNYRLSDLQIKNPYPLSRAGILLRSLADLNRRKRFCRPLPNHSAKRPLFMRRKVRN